MEPTQLNTACASYQNIDKATLHTADPGNTGDNDSGITPVAITWSTPAAGQMDALVTFENITGSFTHVGMWDDDVFIEALPAQISDIDNQDLILLLVHKAAV